MDSPLELSFPTRELGQRPANGPLGTCDPDADDTAPQSQPRFRVKRWRRDPPQPPSLLLACPKASVTSPRHQLNRWEEGMVSPNYKPSGGITLSVGGLAPPSMTRRAGGLEDFACGGLPNVSSAPSPCMRSTSLACQMALPGSLPKKSAPPGGILSLEVSTPTSQPLSLDAMFVRPTLADSTTMLALHKQLKSQHIQDWLKLLDSAGLRSELFATTNDSLNATLHRSKVIARFAPSTLAAYLKSWNQWSEFCACSGVCPFQPSVLTVADYLQVSSTKSSLGVATAQSRALTWVARYAGLPMLRDALSSPIIKSYTVPSELVLRREAAPLPLSFVVFLETQILRDQGTAADRLIMGCLLVLVWSSLRWSDATWVSPSSLTIDVDAIRGVANKTKTTTRGCHSHF